MQVKVQVVTLRDDGEESLHEVAYVERDELTRQGARPAARRGEGVRWRGGIRARPGRAHQREGGWGARGGRTRSVEKGL